MAHELTIKENGTAEMFVSGTPAWHGLGINVEKAQTWKEAIRLAQLDWKVEKLPLQAADGRKAPGVFGLFREDNKRFLGRGGDDYEIIQNEKAFDWVDTIIGKDKAHYASAGSLYGGSTIWCLAELPEEIRIKGTDDITKNYLLFTDYRRIGKSAIIKNVQERVVCHNTLTAALAEDGEKVTIRHKDIDAQLKKAEIVLGAARTQIKDINQIMNALAKCKLKSATIGDILKDLFPKLEDSTIQQNKARDILNLFEDNDRNAFPSEAGSAYALMNAGTHFTDHVATARVADETETDEVARKRAALFGAGEAFKFAMLTSIVTTLSKGSLLSVSDSEAYALGLK